MVPVKVAFDQTVWSGVWNSIYFVALGLLRFESPATILKELKPIFFPLLTVRVEGVSSKVLWDGGSHRVSEKYVKLIKASLSDRRYSFYSCGPSVWVLPIFFLPSQAGWKLWPFAHIVTYGVMPVEQRLLWVDMVELVWVTILSMIVNETTETKKGELGEGQVVGVGEGVEVIVDVVESEKKKEE